MPSVRGLVCVVMVLLPYACCWPGMPWYECHCPSQPQCASYMCRSKEFICTCDECSCFRPEKSLTNEVESLEKDIALLDKLLGGQYQALFGKK